MDLIITILYAVTKDLPISPRFTPYDFLKTSKYIWDPAPGGVFEGGGPGWGLPPPGTAAVSKHETGTVTKKITGARWGGPGGVSPPGTAAVSKHETGTVTKQTTGAVSTHETGTVTKQTTGARWGGPGGFPPRHGCCVQARDRYCD